jgi:hypothetical protein
MREKRSAKAALKGGMSERRRERRWSLGGGDEKGEAGGMDITGVGNATTGGKGEERESEAELGPALNPPEIVSRRSPLRSLLFLSLTLPPPSLPQCLHPPFMQYVPLAFLFVPLSRFSFPLYLAQEPPAYCPAHPGSLPAALAYPSLRMFRCHQIRVRCPLTGHRPPS